MWSCKRRLPTADRIKACHSCLCLEFSRCSRSQSRCATTLDRHGLLGWLAQLVRLLKALRGLIPSSAMSQRTFIIVLLLLCVLLCPLVGAPISSTFDLVITGGRIIDGTGSPWYSGDIGI